MCGADSGQRVARQSSASSRDSCAEAFPGHRGECGHCGIELQTAAGGVDPGNTATRRAITNERPDPVGTCPVLSLHTG